MIKKTISYVDFDDNERTEDHYFNFSKAELIEMEATHPGGLKQHLEAIVNSKDGRLIIKEFKQLIMNSYGVKSEDGKRFVKNQDVLDSFTQSGAFHELFMELATNAEAAAEFVNGIIPKDLQKDLSKLVETNKTVVEGSEDDRPAWLKENRNPTQQEIRGMSNEELQEAFRKRLIAPSS